jgi:diketogulonate reductase-like aldo/keto reductase
VGAAACPALQNEEQIAEALQEARIPRDSVFITSKISPYEMGAEKAEAAVQAILKRLQIDQLVSSLAPSGRAGGLQGRWCALSLLPNAWCSF